MSDYANDYRHPADTNLKSVHKAMDYNALGEPILRTSSATDPGSFTVSGENSTVPIIPIIQISSYEGLRERDIQRYTGSGQQFNLLPYNLIVPPGAHISLVATSTNSISKATISGVWGDIG